MGIRNRRKRRLMKIAGILLVLVISAAVLLLFQTRKIDVYGNTRHSSQEIAAGLQDGMLGGNTLYLLWKYKDGEIPDTLPFLNSLHVQMKSPFHIEVQVAEKSLAGYVDRGEYVYFDQDGLVLEIAGEVHDGIPIITGITVEEPALYQKLPTESSAQLRTILSLTQLLSYHEISASEIRFGENMEMTVFLSGVEAQLGQDEYLEEKVANLKKIMPQIEGQRGIVHLESFTGRGETVSFTPSDEPEPALDTADDAENKGAQDGGAGDGDAQGATPGDGGAGDGDAQGATPGDGGTGDDKAQSTDAENDGADNGDVDNGDADKPENAGTVYPMVFNSSGTLVYNVHVENGVVVDAYGNPVPGVTINEKGNVVDAYMNEFDSATGELAQ